MASDLTGKVAIITGGAQGFGEGIAAKFAAEGARLMLADLNGDLVAETAKGLGAKSCRADVSTDADVAAHFEATL